MIWIILSTLSSTGIFVIFKLIDRAKANLLNVIIINYLVASLFGFFLKGNFPIKEIVSSEWFFAGILIGILFIVMFFIIGLSSIKVGISITTVASKMSVIIPILFAIIAYSEPLGFVKVFAIFLAFIAVFLTVFRKTNESNKLNLSYLFLPIILFIGMGMVDSLVIFSKEKYVNDEAAALFTATLFGFSFLSGLVAGIFNPKSFLNFRYSKNWILGISLGIVNFGSIYLILRALNSGIFNNSIVYGIVNIGIVTLSVIIGTLFFKEKLTKLNYIGISLSIISIFLLSIAESV